MGNCLVDCNAMPIVINSFILKDMTTHKLLSITTVFTHCNLSKKDQANPLASQFILINYWVYGSTLCFIIDQELQEVSMWMTRLQGLLMWLEIKLHPILLPICLQDENNPIVVRYIASIDRRNSVAHASETLDLVLELMQTTNLIVGIDLSGDMKVRGLFCVSILMIWLCTDTPSTE